jgi:hypothetical protein
LRQVGAVAAAHAREALAGQQHLGLLVAEVVADELDLDLVDPVVAQPAREQRVLEGREREGQRDPAVRLAVQRVLQERGELLGRGRGAAVDVRDVGVMPKMSARRLTSVT